MTSCAAGKIAIVTGGAAGLGRAFVEELLNGKAKHVAIFDVSVNTGKILENVLNNKYGKNKTKFIKCDVSNEQHLAAAYKAVVDEHEQIDIVFNNAGAFDEINIARMMNINLTGMMNSTIKALELMRVDEGGVGGTIVNVASTAAIIETHIFPIYSATKVAVLKFSRGMGSPALFDRTKVRVVTLCPGFTATPLMSLMQPWHWKHVQELHDLIGPLRLQSPGSVAVATMAALGSAPSGAVLTITDTEMEDITEFVQKSNLDVVTAVKSSN